MKRLDRLLSIALLLSARRRLRAEALAEQFGISLRTVYRDVRSLVEAGFPIAGTPGDGYSLPSSSQLRPLAMEPTEAEALVMGARLLEQSADDRLHAALLTAVAKLEAVLPPEGVRRVRDQRTRVRLGGTSRGSGPLGLLLEAVTERLVIKIVYNGATRDIEPLGLVRVADFWLIPAWCRLREDMRAFRADRILSASLTDEHFIPRPGVSLDSFSDRGERGS
jgi:predicted DNA-binding transcriptional regulator YafY